MIWGWSRKGKRDLLFYLISHQWFSIDIPNKRVDVEILEGLDDED